MSRRSMLAFLGGIALFPAELYSQQESGGQVRKVHNRYSPSVPLEEFNDSPPAVIKREILPDPKLQACSVMTDIRGEIFVYSLQFLQESGWIEGERKSRRASELANPIQSFPAIPTFTPDIRVGRGSGFFLTRDNQDFLVSNWHVFANASSKKEEDMALHRQADIAMIAASNTNKSLNDKHPLYRAIPPPKDITNENITKHSVRLYGMGSDLFCIEGIPIHCELQSDSGSQNKDKMFALKIPRNKIDHPDQFKGISGSPVTLTKTGEVVGVFHCSTTMGENFLVIFSGPDDIRTALTVATERELIAKAANSILAPRMKLAAEKK